MVRAKVLLCNQRGFTANYKDLTMTTTYYVQSLVEGKMYTIECASLKEAIDIAAVFECQGFDALITKM